MKDEPNISYEISREEMLELYQQLAEARHSVNNSLAVMMALAELTKRKPEEHCDKLISAVLVRGNDIVEQMTDFSKSFVEKMQIEEK